MKRGVTLVPGTIVVLSLDGTLVYVESLEPTFAAVVALPEQPATCQTTVFSPGRVGAKKISPFSSFEREVAVSELTAKNVEFIGTYEQVRKDRGPNTVLGYSEATMSVTKAGPAPRGQGKRALARAAQKTPVCAKCGQQRGHICHPHEHEYIAPAMAASPVEQVAAPKRAAKVATDKVAPVFTLISADLKKAKTQKRGERYDDGNRQHRVVVALASLPGKSGTLEEIAVALLNDGHKPPANPLKVIKRTMSQLSKPDYGSCVTSSGQAQDDDAEEDGE